MKNIESRRASAKKGDSEFAILFPNTIGEIECKLRDCNIQIESRIVIAIFVLQILIVNCSWLVAVRGFYPHWGFPRKFLV